jgi:hypothetical protein
MQTPQICQAQEEFERNNRYRDKIWNQKHNLQNQKNMNETEVTHVYPSDCDIFTLVD